ncbi:Octaprenyl-diphosphate synthase [compost metagenome]
MGKNVGDDLAEGKPTLPLLRAMAVGTPEERQLIRDAIEHRNGMEHLERILAILERTGALEHARQRAREEADKAIAALAILPDSQHRQALETLAQMAVQRSA